MKKLSVLLALTFATHTALFADEAAAPAAPDQGFMQTLVMVAVALFFFYFILWRPEQKRRKALETQRSGMKKGDRVVCMGVVGTIVKIKEDTLVVRSGDAELEFLKAAISEVQPTAASGHVEEATK